MKKIVFEEYFNESDGKPFIYKGKELRMSDRITLPSGKIDMKINFVSTNSEWKQGIVLQTKGEFSINGQKILDKVVFWEHTAPKEIELIIKSKDKVLYVYNVWDTGDGTMHYGHNGGAISLEEIDGVRIYNCNDGHADDNLNDLIFTIKY